MTSKSGRQRSAARLAAVQALYTMDITGKAVEQVLDDFLKNGILEESEAEDGLVTIDPRMFTEIVRGATAFREDIDAMIEGALTGDWSAERLEAVLRAILRAGAFELAHRSDVPLKVAISEYVDVAYAFYSGPEPGLVNAVLDRIGKVVRDVPAA